MTPPGGTTDFMAPEQHWVLVPRYHAIAREQLVGPAPGFVQNLRQGAVGGCLTLTSAGRSPDSGLGRRGPALPAPRAARAVTIGARWPPLHGEADLATPHNSEPDPSGSPERFHRSGRPGTGSRKTGRGHFPSSAAYPAAEFLDRNAILPTRCRVPAVHAFRRPSVCTIQAEDLMRAYLFCSGKPSTKEDAWPQWLMKRFKSGGHARVFAERRERPVGD